MTIQKFSLYKKSGVNIESAHILMNKIKSIARSTYTKEVMSRIGGFAALCDIPKIYNQPILALSTDGVGTKLRLAIDTNMHKNIGIDLVAMCVNDILTQGAKPIFFLDYYATGKLDIKISVQIIEGIIKGCKISQCALVGGETSEMPGIYKKKDYDLSGFCVGIANKSNLINTNQVNIGDSILALSSSGLHSNGYSLIRKIILQNKINYRQYTLDHKKLIDHLLIPTRIYVKSILNLMQKINIHAIAHITGGGLIENIPRVLPKKTCALIKENTWKWPIIFKWLSNMASIKKSDMYNIFNCGIGMIIVISKKDTKKSLKILKDSGENAWKIGKIVPRSLHKKSIFFENISI